MRRADRLFQIVQLIRGRRLTTAAHLAQRLEVSLRTVYRDIADLQHQGVPIEGEAGVGYRLGAGFDLPPLMFTHDEARALVASVRMAQVWQDPALAQAAEVALGKILSVLPTAARVAAQAMAVYAPPIGLEPAVQTTLQTLASERLAMLRNIGPLGPVRGKMSRRMSTACVGSGTRCAGVRASRFFHSRNFIFSGGQRQSFVSKSISSQCARRNCPGRWNNRGERCKAARAMT